MRYAVYYMKPGSFARFIDGNVLPTIAELDRTHTYLPDVSADDLEHVWTIQQAETWSRGSEAMPLIKRLGLDHTSMSIGDVVADERGYWVVGRMGFKEIA